MGERERVVLVAVLLAPVVPVVASFARIFECLAGPEADPTLVPPAWPVPLFTRVGVAGVVALMAAGPAWRWVSTDVPAAVRRLPAWFVVAAAIVSVQALVWP
jgi:hypothetical protein